MGGESVLLTRRAGLHEGLGKGHHPLLSGSRVTPQVADQLFPVDAGKAVEAGRGEAYGPNHAGPGVVIGLEVVNSREVVKLHIKAVDGQGMANLTGRVYAFGWVIG